MKPLWFVDQQDSVFRINCRFEIEGKTGGLVEFLPAIKFDNAISKSMIIDGIIERMTYRKDQFIAGAKNHG